MTMYVTSAAGRTPRNASEANMNGRRYRLCSPSPGTQSRSARTSWVTDSRKTPAGSSGRARRRAERAKRSALASGRKVHTEPSGCRYAFMPSKISCA
ncbi:hypothetical protein SF12_11245 [Streptomyces sp. MBRL 601]|nr:hypothetical protein SF12_11245 [Streptomyces sp. MBRL 601]